MSSAPPKCPNPRGVWTERVWPEGVWGPAQAASVLCVLLPGTPRGGGSGERSRSPSELSGDLLKPPRHPQGPRTSPKSPAAQLEARSEDHCPRGRNSGSQSAGEQDGGKRAAPWTPQLLPALAKPPAGPVAAPLSSSSPGGVLPSSPACLCPACHCPQGGGQAPASSGMGFCVHTPTAGRAGAMAPQGLPLLGHPPLLGAGGRGRRC